MFRRLTLEPDKYQNPLPSNRVCGAVWNVLHPLRHYPVQSGSRDVGCAFKLETQLIILFQIKKCIWK